MKIKTKKIYLRFGTCPTSGRSQNHRDDMPEPGVSCYQAHTDDAGVLHLCLVTTSLVGSLATMLDRPVYVITGEVVGTGSDGEPCLDVMRARRWYGTLTTPFGPIAVTRGFASQKAAIAARDAFLTSRTKAETNPGSRQYVHAGQVTRQNQDWGFWSTAGGKRPYFHTS